MNKLKDENTRLREVLTRLEMAASDAIVLLQPRPSPSDAFTIRVRKEALVRAIQTARKLLSGVTTDETK